MAKRKIFSIFVLVSLLSTLVPVGGASAAALPTSWKAPGSLMAAETSQFEFQTSIFFSVDSAVLAFIDPEQTDHDALGINSISHTAQIDWKLNDGPWHYSADWDAQSEDYGVNSGIYAQTGYLDGETTQEVSIFDLRNGDGQNTELQSMLGAAITRADDEGGYGNRLDLANNTFSFRVRLYVSYWNPTTETNGYILSPWSETLTYGKGAAQLVKPTSLEKAVISNPVVGANNDGSPNITFTVLTPKQVQDANNYIQAKDATMLEVQHQININNTGWKEAAAGVWWLSGETRAIDVPATYDDGKVVEVDKANIQVRMRYAYAGSANVGALVSDWSNVIALNTPAWGKVSPWAAGDLKLASDLGLIPDMLKGSDMTKPITREEFCELAVLLYEKVTGKTATPTSPNPFGDTANNQILKAHALKITGGTSAIAFSPKVLINREQCAAMLFRTIKAIQPTADYSVAGVKNFTDQKQISPFATEASKYMSRLGIIGGDAKGNFMPKATTSAQTAAGYGMATREQAILMAYRTHSKIGK